ncbi:MAG TPA: DUF433 domain-containing protein [Pyrinomonadaceae bacterium]
MKNEVIELDPNKVSGAPVFAGTRVPIKNLFDYLEGGDSPQDFLEGFPPVKREQAMAILEMNNPMVSDLD